MTGGSSPVREDQDGSEPNPESDPARSDTDDPISDENWEKSRENNRTALITLGIAIVTACIVIAILLYQYLQYSAVEKELERRSDEISDVVKRQDGLYYELNSAKSDLSSARGDLDYKLSSLLTEPGEVDVAKEKVAYQTQQVESRQQAYEAVRQQAIELDVSKGNYTASQQDALDRILITLVLIVVVIVMAFLLARAIRSERRRIWENKQLVESGPPGQPPDLSAATLWQRNEESLQYYHKLVQNYSASSRQLTISVIIGEFVFLLLMGSTFIFINETSTAVAAGVASVVFAGVTGFVSNVILRNTESSVNEVRQFFRHPLDVQRTLTAQLVVEDMTDEKGKDSARIMIVEGLMKSVPEVSSSEPSKSDLRSA